MFHALHSFKVTQYMICSHGYFYRVGNAKPRCINDKTLVSDYGCNKQIFVVVLNSCFRTLYTLLQEKKSNIRSEGSRTKANTDLNNGGIVF